ncbi:hypothetical protein P1P91_10910 [Halomonas piscis]|uniref:Phage major capsid protein n=1 Tax=Halomonas piscis TaxID=3031727 RepID=A0ABY9YXM1_9GAMM|nr:hypothetical protein [Halomonas piscis]WNK19362.1 hypothetical protein P1P91_10910 [Halomonas piscis]
MAEQHDELHRLRSHADDLLTEVKAVKKERNELREQVEALTGERDAAQGELNRVTVEEPRRAVFEEVAAKPEVADALEREVLHHADIADDGALLDKAGEPLKGEDGEPLSFGEAGIQHLATTVAPALMGMIRPINKSVGGGAPGSRGGNPPTTSQAVKTKPSPYGLK